MKNYTGNRGHSKNLNKEIGETCRVRRPEKLKPESQTLIQVDAELDLTTASIRATPPGAATEPVISYANTDNLCCFQHRLSWFQLKVGFNQNFCTFTLILLIKIVLCCKFS